MSATPDPSVSSPAPSDLEETPAQRQARLRRERRNAKIQGDPNARLAAISNISGRKGPPPETTPTRPVPASVSPSPSPAPPAYSTSTPDPEIDDISSHAFPARSLTPSLQQQQQQQQQQIPDDPMLAMMQQMMRGLDPNASSAPGAPGDMPPGFPPGIAKMFEAMNGSGGAAGGAFQQDLQQPAPSSAYLWRIVHAIFSLVLAVYVAYSTSFTGSKLSRTQSQYSNVDQPYTDDFYTDHHRDPTAGLSANQHVGQRLFWLFATVEIVLQSSRYFLEKGRLPQSGLLGSLSQMLPEPYAGYARVVGRYSVIWSTVVADAMVVIFVLGAVSWTKGSLA